jgi:ubiquinone/menaquinone biosynthesis C-methylase UbiE
LDETQLGPGETVLEVGCGTGVLGRWLAQRTGGENPIVGVDINPFFLREAEALVRIDRLESVIQFKEGSAEELPFSDNSFDVAFSSTVIQRVNADLLLKEIVRVTKPGGRVAVLGHAHDMPRWINLPLPEDLKLKIESPPWVTDRGHERGCDDAGLYRRFNQIGLSQIKMFPYMATFADGSRLQMLQTGILPTLNAEETEEWRRAVAQAQEEGTFFISTPFHCAVGAKP